RVVDTHQCRGGALAGPALVRTPRGEPRVPAVGGEPGVDQQLASQRIAGDRPGLAAVPQPDPAHRTLLRQLPVTRRRKVRAGPVLRKSYGFRRGVLGGGHGSFHIRAEIALQKGPPVGAKWRKCNSHLPAWNGTTVCWRTL